ncbi:MAG: ABC transporter substrate-binding protein [Armatimonadetes bacterium]|nr:ABC transporter substrate-binding protein [Armatimonadota bacterium]
MRLTRRFVLLAVLILAMAVAGGPGPAGGAPAIVELRVRALSEFGTMDPAQVGSATDDQVLVNIYSQLVRMRTGTSELVPELAERWTVSPDGKVYTFHVRRGVKWHKGFGELTSDDVKFTLERHLDPSVRSRRRALFANVEAVNTPNEYTIEIRLKQPSPGFMRTAIAEVAGYILSRKAVTQLGREHALNPIGTGPYVWDRYRKGSELVLVANEEYFNKPARIKRVVWLPIPEDVVAYTALQAGNIDLMYFRSGEVFRQARANPRVVVMTASAQSVRGIYFNTRRAPLTDRRVRQAIAHMINKEYIVKYALHGTGQVADSVISPQTWGYTSNVRKYPPDLEKAKQLLREAGHEQGFKINLVYPFQDPYQTWAPVIQDQLRRVNITVELVGLEFVSAIQRASRGDYDMFTLGLTRPPDPDVYFSTGWYGPSAPPGQAFTFYDGADRMIDQARSEVDDRRRRALVEQVQRRIAEDVPGLPIYYAFSMVAMHPKVKGHLVGILNDLWLHSMSIDERAR